MMVLQQEMHTHYNNQTSMNRIRQTKQRLNFKAFEIRYSGDCISIIMEGDLSHDGYKHQGKDCELNYMYMEIVSRADDTSKDGTQ